jgi:hypothetical protein
MDDMQHACNAALAPTPIKPERRAKAAGLLLLAMASFSLQALAAPSSPATQAADVAGFLQAQMQQRGIPGMQVAVVRHGEIVLLGAYGLASVDDLTVIILTNLLGASPVQFVDGVSAFYLPSLRAERGGAGR